jgi:hypothetical protein
VASDLKLNGEGDLDMTGGGAALVSGNDETIQNVKIRLRFFRGEWFLDNRLGVPFFADVLVKRPDLQLVEFDLLSAITATPGIAQVTAFSLDWSRAARSLRVDFAALTDSGQAFVLAEDIAA